MPWRHIPLGVTFAPVTCTCCYCGRAFQAASRKQKVCRGKDCLEKQKAARKDYQARYARRKRAKRGAR